MISGGILVVFIAFFIPHEIVLPSLFFTFCGSAFLSYEETLNLFAMAFSIVSVSYFMLSADLMEGNFFVICKTADATCLEPPYFKIPAMVTNLPVLTILPSNPSMFTVDMGFFSE